MMKQLSALALLLALGGLAVGCNGDDGGGEGGMGAGSGGSSGTSGGSGGASGSSGGSGGASGGGSGGASGSSGGTSGGSGGAGGGSGGGSGGASGMSGGSGGSSGGSGGSGGSFDPGDVDLTLDGLNQDLPEPPVDCTELEGDSVRCLAFSAEIEGESLAYACMDSEIASGVGDMRGLGCTGDSDGTSWSMGISISPDAIAAIPGAYMIHATKAAPIDYDAVGLQYGGVPGEVAQMNFEELRLNGWVVRVMPALSDMEADQIVGAFAATWGEPDPSDEACAEDAFGNHCAPIRVRGTFKANIY